jgi:hypothetical protein
MFMMPYGCGTATSRHKLAENGHVVGVEHAEADAEEHARATTAAVLWP